MRGPRSPLFKGGCFDKDGYWQYRPAGAPRQRRAHRVIMEIHLGRPLTKDEIVHHKDGNRSNNAIGNLELLPSNAVHMSGHSKGFRNATHKQCNKCGLIKPREEFPLGNRRRKNGDPNHPHCKACRSAYKADRYARGLIPPSQRIKLKRYKDA